MRIRTLQGARLACVVLALSSSGCLTLSDDERAVLHLHLRWDDTVGSSGFDPASCHGAGVELMDWALFDEDGEEVVGAKELCAEQIDILESVPGRYRLYVAGFDEDGDKRWEGECTKLDVFRFDVAYRCDIASN